MTKPSKPKPRPTRSGALLVELTPEYRAMLETLAAERTAETGDPQTKSSTVRWLIRTEFARRDLVTSTED